MMHEAAGPFLDKKKARSFPAVLNENTWPY